MHIQTLDQHTFDPAIASSPTPVLVDFWAEWCGPCKMLAPLLEELAAEQAGKALIVKVNIDESPELAVRFGATSIPMLMVFKNGQPVQTARGIQSRRALAAMLAPA